MDRRFVGGPSRAALIEGVEQGPVALLAVGSVAWRVHEDVDGIGERMVSSQERQYTDTSPKGIPWCMEAVGGLFRRLKPS